MNNLLLGIGVGVFIVAQVWLHLSIRADKKRFKEFQDEMRKRMNDDNWEKMLAEMKNPISTCAGCGKKYKHDEEWSDKNSDKWLKSKTDAEYEFGELLSHICCLCIKCSNSVTLDVSKIFKKHNIK